MAVRAAIFFPNEFLQSLPPPVRPVPGVPTEQPFSDPDGQLGAGFDFLPLDPNYSKDAGSNQQSTRPLPISWHPNTIAKTRRSVKRNDAKLCP